MDVFQQHEHKLYTLALCLVKSEQYVKDIIQEVFMKLWEHRHHLQDINNMEAWLYRVMENKVIDFFRKRCGRDAELQGGYRGFGASVGEEQL